MDKTFRIRLGIAYLIVSLFGVGVLVRAVYIMLLPSQRLQAAMERQFRQEPPRAPRRGYILDRNHEPLAVSLDVKSLFANPGKIENKAWVSAQIAKYLGLNPQFIRQKLKPERGFVWIKRQLSQEEEKSAKAMLERYPQLNAVLGLSRESKRFYPNQGLAAHVLGFNGLDSNGLEGVELAYEKDLAGEAKKTAMTGMNLEGKTLILSIDKALQNTLEMELEQGVQHAGAKGGTAILMDADNGEVIAMASSPTYNPNKFHVFQADARRNRAVTDTYEPGSTIKTILIAGTIEQKIFSPDSKVFCEYGKMQIGKHWVNEAETKDKWGWLKISEVLQHSSNVGATKIGFAFGTNRMFDWYKKMGLTVKTGVDLPGEVSGALADAKSWSKIAHSNISFGQGISVTPIQMLRAYAAIANGGKLVQPRILRQIISGDGEVVKETEIKSAPRVMQLETTQIMKKIMARVTTPDGTAPKAAIAGFTISGKTGTAQKPFHGHGYRAGKYIASFIGFPLDVKPNYVALVMVDEPRFPYFGGEVAAPIFQKIMTAALARAGATPKQDAIMSIRLAVKEKSEVPAPLTFAEMARDLKEIDGNLSMPNLIGSSARDVLDLFHRKEVDLKVSGAGVVVEQFPAAGAKFKRGEMISIRLERTANIQ